MDWPFCSKLLLAAFLLAAAAIHGVRADAMVTGTVFCDQCKDGRISLFDYPLHGMKVAVTCADSNGEYTVWREETTNWFGNYAMRFEGTPDLSGCYARVSGGGGGCGAVGGPARSLRLMFRMFDMEMFTVDPLLSEPAQPMSFCPGSYKPAPPPLITPAPPPPLANPSPLPPLPPAPPLPQLPPMPFLEASACPHWNWTMPEYRCYWKVVTPDMKVAVVFGLIAARRFGTDMTLWQGIQGRGDPYRTLLREATTALLNSYNSLQFGYHPLGVIQDMNLALMGSVRRVLFTALGFRRANSGYGRAPCRFNPCK
ncbi:uncharacterized protein LOC127802085 [Diospyros lotus]|uniref:uncharacterized protein LOC127802085 n=1 Tax=Diospyros lotus TaxID=55363 RepID=UPI0022572BF0|nr:uncharacterized protein LOC127802085 [Diospyros lotus]